MGIAADKLGRIVRAARRLCLGGAWLLAAANPGGLVAREASAEFDFFEARIRPVLVARCYECHGPDREPKGGLRLDSRQGWQTGGDSGPAIVPGKPDESLLLQALRYDPSFVEMPPRGKLSARIVQDFETWIAQGAADPRVASAATSANATPRRVAPKVVSAQSHWAYRPLRPAAVPTVINENWPRDPLDRFILTRLEASQLEPAADADRAKLVRRLYFDLLGLPPTPRQIDALLADAAPDAIERLVDKLLASPHFGERWGRHWLDVVRFAESVTLRGLILPDAWRFRDYVIDAFNSDRPVDQMLREHVAGDLLPADSSAERQRQCVASSFLTLGNWNLEEQDKQQLRMDVVDEQLDTLGKAFLAQTIGCARCHDHKFDPIPTKDYYALAGILRNAKTLEDANVSKWLERPLPLPPEEELALAEHERRLAALEKQLKLQTDALAALDPSAKLPDVTSLKSLAGVVIDDQQARAVGIWEESQSNKPYIGRGYRHDLQTGRGEKTLTFEPVLAAGRYEVRLAYTPGANRASNVPVTVFSAEGEKSVLLDQRQPPPIERHWTSLGVYRFEQNGQSFVIVANDGADGHVVADAVQFLPVDQNDKDAGASDAAATTNSTASFAAVSAKNNVDEAARSAARQEVKQLKQTLAQLRKQGPQRPTYVAVAEEAKIEETFVHIRGNVHQLGEPSPRGFLTAIAMNSPPPIPADQSGRVELSAWLTHADNPLAARVFVNRVWHWLFGAGLVRTPDNFGSAGEAPSHPELLDYLAAQFRDDGWSTKRLIRRIVLSRTYQLASGLPAAAGEIDPENRLLSHAHRRRLDAESLRDALLSISGELDPTFGGSTIDGTIAADFDYQHEHLRRSVYCAVLRNKLPEIFEVFDFADPSTVTGARNVSTVAPQALFLLNDPFVVARAESAASRVLSQPDLTTEARIDLAFRLALGRLPNDTEQQLATAHIMGANDATAEHAAWTSLLQAIFGSIDFRYLD